MDLLADLKDYISLNKKSYQRQIKDSLEGCDRFKKLRTKLETLEEISMFLEENRDYE